MPAPRQNLIACNTCGARTSRRAAACVNCGALPPLFGIGICWLCFGAVLKPRNALRTKRTQGTIWYYHTDCFTKEFALRDFTEICADCGESRTRAMSKEDPFRVRSV